MGSLRKTERYQLILLAGVCLIAGCGHNPGFGGPPTVTKTDPMSKMFDSIKQANYKIDIAIDDLGNAIDQTGKLATVAGGDAQTALATVAEQLNSAGEALSEVEDPPASLAEYSKDFSTQDEQRLNSIDASTKALQRLRRASDILDDLSSNVPNDKKQPLQEIEGEADEAEGNLEDAVKLMGGTIPDDKPEESHDIAGDAPDPKSGKNTG